VTAARTPLWTSLGELTAPPDPLADFKGAVLRRGGEGEGRGGDGMGKRGEGQKWREGEGEVDSDAQLEQGCRLAKAGPRFMIFSLNVLTLVC